MNQGIEALIIFGICATALMGCASVGSGGANTKLSGDWICVSAVVDGKALPEPTASALRLRITQDRYTTSRGADVLFDSAYRLDTKANPSRIFMMGTEGELTGREAQGIYKLAGDALTLCYTMPGDPAPAGFASEPGSKAYLIVWRRSGP